MEPEPHHAEAYLQSQNADAGLEYTICDFDYFETTLPCRTEGVQAEVLGVISIHPKLAIS
jgi:hypothetical protein